MKCRFPTYWYSVIEECVLTYKLLRGNAYSPNTQGRHLPNPLDHDTFRHPSALFTLEYCTNITLPMLIYIFHHAPSYCRQITNRIVTLLSANQKNHNYVLFSQLRIFLLGHLYFINEQSVTM